MEPIDGVSRIKKVSSLSGLHPVSLLRVLFNSDWLTLEGKHSVVLSVPL